MTRIRLGFSAAGLSMLGIAVGCAASGQAERRVSVPVVSGVQTEAKRPCCAKGTESSGEVVKTLRPAAPVPTLVQGAPLIPDVELLDQYGKPVRFYSDLVRGKTVVISFFFTSCTTICPPLTATLTQVQELLKEDGRDDIQLISISVDPVTDTPTRLRSWSKNYNVQAGWRFVTGKKRTVDDLLKALHSFTPDPQDHSPMILVGNEPKGLWKQVYGLASASDLRRAIVDVAGPKPESAKDAPASLNRPASVAAPAKTTNEAARNYFGDVELIDQNGNAQRLYSDLLDGRVVVISSFFASCVGVCPVMNQKLTAIREAFPDRFGRDLFFLSISVDPTVDTPDRLKAYANSLGAGEGWYFLTGKKANVDLALHKLGLYTETREGHSNLFLVGNVPTGLWKKALGLAAPAELAGIVDSVLNDDEGDHDGR